MAAGSPVASLLATLTAVCASAPEGRHSETFA